MGTSAAHPVSGITRRLPGVALRDSQERVVFSFGHITYASPRVLYVDHRHAEHRLVFFMGETYFYWCQHCRCTVYEEEVMRVGSRRCVFCKNWLVMLQEGDLIRLHYRFAKDASWGNWWGEKWEP